MAVHTALQPPVAMGATLVAVRPWRWTDPVLFGTALFALLMLASPSLLGDPDSHWHVAVGRLIWDGGAVPWTDPFSHTVLGDPWIAKEWLSQLLLFAAHRAGGWTGVVLVTGAALGLLFTLLFAWLERRLRITAAMTLALLTALFLAPHFLARPHVFAFLPLFLWVRGLVDALDERRAPSPWLLLVIVLWANLHGSFTFAYPLAALLALEAVLTAPTGRHLGTIIRWGAFGLAALLAGCLTPYGVHSLLVTFTVFGSGESLPYINEWQPIGWTMLGFLSVGLAVALSGALLAGGWRNAIRIAAIGLLAAMTIRHSRFLDVFALVVPLLVAVPLATRFPELGAETPTDRERWEWPKRLAILLLAATGLVAAFVRGPEPGPKVTPREALAAAREAGLRGPVYNSYDYGGFLIAEGVPTFIDGRTDQLYLGGFISGLFGAVGKAEHQPFFDFIDRYRVTWAIVPSKGKEQAHFAAMPAWRLIHRDGTAAVYAKERLRGSLD
ncbi:hypothetical protein [Enterovirga rhinocerotis]|uniref:4-amino-4-deoxy-L-arabinose transferase-like glycosyltransferase n=1 Tax=Enterovirga rhinocerotis TaxID=1339210 RepID=A0A4R7BNR9_9HYPH|nr:hypothetical protein [Enterovirga rhinocerotis]TDR87148.1 hypothetical protein EV668_4228 [Enterovirga rhinocerotis]